MIRRNENIITRVNELETNIKELKTSQPTRGDGWRVYILQTESGWDLEFNNQSPGFDVQYKITPIFESTTTSPLRFVRYENDTDDDGIFIYSFAPPNEPDSLYVRFVYGYDTGGVNYARFKAIGLSPFEGTLSIDVV